MATDAELRDLLEPWQKETAPWRDLLAEGVDPGEVDTRRWGHLSLWRAASDLQRAVERVTAGPLMMLEGKPGSEVREYMEAEFGEVSIMPEEALKEWRAEFARATAFLTQDDVAARWDDRGEV